MPSRPSRGRASSALAGIHPRSLTLFRVGLALLLLWDLAVRSRHLAAHYTDRGIVPRNVLLAWRGDSDHVSLHLANGEAWFAATLFLLAAAAAVALLLGYRSGPAAFVSWLLLCSLHARNPLVLHGGDGLLRVLLFWAMLLPLGTSRSGSPVPAPSRDAPVVSVATLAVKVQVCLVYWTAAALKLHPIWTEERTAIAMALQLDQLATTWGRALLAAPELLQVVTLATLGWEILGPMLVWIPFGKGRIQMATVAGFWVFHLLLLAPAMALGNFPWVAAVAWTIFLPARFWETRGGAALVEAGTGIARWGRTLPTRRSVVSGFRPPDRTGWPSGVAAALALGLVVAWNLRAVDPDRYGFLVPPGLESVAEATGLEQRWNLFAPFPAVRDGWFTAPGRLAGGETVDVLTGEPEVRTKPAVFWRRPGDERERTLRDRLVLPEYAAFRRPLGRWICRDWNEGRPAELRLESFVLVYHLELTDPAGPREMEPVPLRIWSQICSLPERNPTEDGTRSDS